jgi:hypothetical protein
MRVLCIAGFVFVLCALTLGSAQSSAGSIPPGQLRKTPTPIHEPTPTPPATATPTPEVLPTPTATPPPTATGTPTSAPVAGQPCPTWVHDRSTTIGPDGASYPTWHPAVDPQYGCLFGHEHGADPRTSPADATMPAFGYVSAQLGMVEPHVGFKVFAIPCGAVTDNGTVATGDYRIVFHMGTSGVGRYTEQFHSVEYDYVACDGSGRYAHAYGMANTGAAVGSTCDDPRQGGRDFSTIGCPDAYEIWSFGFAIVHPDDEFTDPQHVRTFLGGSVAAFDPVTTRDPADNARLVYTQEYRASGPDPLSPQADYRGCQRESYGGPNFWANAGQPAVYDTDPYGRVQPGPGPGTIRQETSALDSRLDDFFKWRQDFCGGGVHAPN